MSVSQKNNIDEEKIIPFDFNYTIKKLDILLNSLLYNSTNNDIKEITKWIIRLPPYCSRLQAGYNCGLVGLRMAIEYIDKTFLESEFVNELFMTALIKGYSKEGEMFNAFHLSEISNLIFNNLDFKYIKSTVVSFPSTSDILNQLSNGLPILVPYDADKNWRPCTLGGQRTHWAMIIGFIIPNHNSSSSSNNNNRSNSGTLKYKFQKTVIKESNTIYDRYEIENPYESICNLNIDNINQYTEKYMFLNNRFDNDGDDQGDGDGSKYKIQFYQKPGESDTFNRLPFINDDYEDVVDDGTDTITVEGVDENQIETAALDQLSAKSLNQDEIFLICQHGKSPIVQLWEYTLLKESNNCLNEFPVERRDDTRWIIPTNLNDLKNKWLFLKK